MRKQGEWCGCNLRDLVQTAREANRLRTESCEEALRVAINVHTGFRSYNTWGKFILWHGTNIRLLIELLRLSLNVSCLQKIRRRTLQPLLKCTRTHTHTLSDCNYLPLKSDLLEWRLFAVKITLDIKWKCN